MLTYVSFMKALDGGELPKLAMDELQPYLKKTKVQRLYPSKLKDGE